jgi:hypothetical protein
MLTSRSPVNARSWTGKISASSGAAGYHEK